MLQKSLQKFKLASLTFSLLASLIPFYGTANEYHPIKASNFGLPGIIDLPTAGRFPDGEFVITHQNHKYLFMNGISFQALPRLGVAFRYGGQGLGGTLAQGRLNWDRSFDAHISVFDEGKYLPSISVGLRDFIGTGWYSSEYIVATKTFTNVEISAGLGFGRLAGRNSFSNPLSNLSSEFSLRGANKTGKGGTLGAINWFKGDASSFYGVRYHFNRKVTLSAEYTSDLMPRERAYLAINSPYNFGASYQLNDYINLSAQYLHGSQVSITAHVTVNPARAPLPGGKELAPVPMRLRDSGINAVKESNETVIQRVLAADRFIIHKLKIEANTISIVVTNTKFRSIAQAVGRIASTMQRFTSDDIKFANISFYSGNLQTATYRVNLDQITEKQFNPITSKSDQYPIFAIDPKVGPVKEIQQRFVWGIGPYIEHRLFNPDLPLSVETGLEIEGGYQFSPAFKISGRVRKSILTNLTDNQRRSNSYLPRVHSDWPLYDFAGQDGHIYELTLSYLKNIAPGVYGRAHAGLLEPFFAGFGGEILYKPAQSPIGIGVDIHHVRKRDFDMGLDLLNYEATVGHLSAYYDAGNMFDVEINVGRYLAGDWGGDHNHVTQIW